MRRWRLFSLLAGFTLLIPHAPAQPNTIVLDGLRDAAYVLLAEDDANDLPVGEPRYAWADLRRLYVATDTENLYAYVDLPQYNLQSAAGELGLAVVVTDTAAAGPRADPLVTRAAKITYAYADAVEGLCAPASLPAVVHPDVLFRGYVYGTADVDNISNGHLARFTGGGTDWVMTDSNWGGLTTPAADHIAYEAGEGLEFSIPWTDLGLEGPASLSLSFFTTAAGLAPGILDVLPPDAAATAAVTPTILSQLAALTLPLPAPASARLGCSLLSAAEDDGPAQVTAQLTTVLTQTVYVSYTTAALTAGLADFTPVTGTLTFAPGSTRQTFAVPITNDSLPEAGENFLVALSTPVGLSLASPATMTVTILDDDSGLPGGRLFVPIVLR